MDPQLNGTHPNSNAAGFTPLHLEGSKYEPISIDISIDSPLHSGLATTEMVCTLMQALPPLGPVVSVVKDYLKLKGLSDAFTGGLNSYGLFILMLLPLLRRLRDSRDLLGCEPIGGVPAPAPTPPTPSAPIAVNSTPSGIHKTAPSIPIPTGVGPTDAAVSDTNVNSPCDKVPVPVPVSGSSELHSVDVGQLSKLRSAENRSDASNAKCTDVDPLTIAEETAISPLPNGANKGSDRKAPLRILTVQDTEPTPVGKSVGPAHGPVHCAEVLEGAYSNCATIQAETAAVVCNDRNSKSNSKSDGLVSSDEIQVETVKVGSGKSSDQPGIGGKVTSVYMQAVARAAQAQSQRSAGTTSTKSGHLSRGSLKRIKESTSSSSEAEDIAVHGSIPVSPDLKEIETGKEKEKEPVGIQCLVHRSHSSFQGVDSTTCSDESATISDCGDILVPCENVGGKSTSPLPLNISDCALSPASPPPSARRVGGEDTDRHSQLPSSLSTSPSSKPMVSSRPPLRPTPPVTLKEYLSVKHSLHSTYTVARSALKPSQSSNVPPPQSPPNQPSPASPKYLPTPPSNAVLASTSLSASTPPKASGPSYDTSPGIALHCSTVNVKSFPAAFTNAHASSGAMATYQYLRPKPSSPFSRGHSISPIATPKQSPGQMQLSSSSKYPMRIIFPSPPPFSSPYKHPSGPSSSSISKAGALYIMNVMNNQRGYTWNNLKQQRDFGRKVAFKLFDLPDNGDFNRSKPRDPAKHGYRNSARDMRVPCVLALEAPILGSLLQDFLLAYGNKAFITICHAAKHWNALIRLC